MQFSETMAGEWTPSDGSPGPLGFEVTADAPEGLLPIAVGTVDGRLTGRLWAEGLAKDAPAIGTIEISPVAQRRIRYTLDFDADDGRRCRFDGWKSIRWTRPLSTWTTLPGTVTEENGAVLGTAMLRFAMRDTGSLVGSTRMTGGSAEPSALHELRWNGRRGRLEVWYETFTDPATGTGFWLHHELCAPADEGSPVVVRGWAAVFPPDGPPMWERYGPEPVDVERGVSVEAARVEPGVRSGRAGDIAWDLEYKDTAPALFTFPAATWRRELLPGTQIVPSPTARFSGTVRLGQRTWHLEEAPGGAARIYGHGSAQRWAWLHADLGGGDVLEVVAAVPRRRGLTNLRPLPLVQLRLDGVDWPAHPLRAAPRLRCEFGPNGWVLTGRSGNRKLEVTVSLPADRTIEVGYTDPDGSTATCTNSERADATVVLWRRDARGRWGNERRWQLDATAHAEMGTRP